MSAYPRSRLTWALVLTTLVGVLSSCTSSTPRTTAAATTPVRLHVTLVQYRPDEGTRNVSAEVTNDGPAPITVTSVALTSPDMARLPPTPKNTVFAPGQTIDLRTRYGEPRCGRRHPAGMSSFSLGLDGLSTTSVRLDKGGLAFLGRLYARECGLADIAAVARVSLGSDYTRVTIGGEQYLRGELDVVRPARSARPGSPLTIQSLFGSVLLSFTPVPGTVSVPVTLAPGMPALRIPVLVGSSGRCDAHALGGSTQTYLLSAFVHLPGRAQQRIIVSPTLAAQGRVQALLHDVCTAG